MKTFRIKYKKNKNYSLKKNDKKNDKKSKTITKKNKKNEKNKKTKKNKKTGGQPPGVITELPVTQGLFASSTVNAIPNSNKINMSPVGPDPIRSELPHITPNQESQTRGVTAPVIPAVPLENVAFPQQPAIYQRNTFTKAVGTTAAVVVGTIAAGATPAVIFSTSIASIIARDAFNENPVGVTATTITPIAQVLAYTGLFTDQQINEGANFVLNQVDPTFSESHYYNIAEQNGNVRVGTTDQVSNGQVIDNPGLLEYLTGLVNGSLNNLRIPTNPNYIHDKSTSDDTKSNTDSNNNLKADNSNGSKSGLTVNNPINVDDAARIAEDIKEGLKDGEQLRNDLRNANRRTGRKAGEAIGKTQEVLNERNEISMNDFNARGEAIRSALNSYSERDMEAENVSIVAQLIIDQGYYDAMPEYQNEETPVDQQYDPRYGEAYAQNVERVITNALRVRQEPNYNPASIGDTSALTCVAAYIIRCAIGRFFKKNKTKKDETKKDRIKIMPEEGQPLEFLVLPEITNEPPRGALQFIPTPSYATFLYNPIVNISNDEDDNDDDIPHLEEAVTLDNINIASEPIIQDEEELNETEDAYPLFRYFIRIVVFAYLDEGEDDYLDEDKKDILESIITKYLQNMNSVDKILKKNRIVELIKERIMETSENDDNKRENLREDLPEIFRIIEDNLSNETETTRSTRKQNKTTILNTDSTNKKNKETVLEKVNSTNSFFENRRR
jgi:hypothetical protein